MSVVLNQGAEKHPITFCYQVNGSCPRTVHPLGIQGAIYLACAAGVLITVLGNLFVVFAVSYFKALHTPTNFLLLSLALADMFLRLLVLPLSTVRSVESCWFFGGFFCRLHTYLDTLFCLTSIFHLCFISIDRHCAICEPLLYPSKVTVRVALRYILAGWGVPAAYTAFLLYADVVERGLSQWLEEMPCVGSCQLLFNKFWGWLNFPMFFFPCLIMISLYVKIFVVASRQAQQINSLSKSLAGAAKRERKAAKTLGIAVGVYLLCWLPFTIDTMVDSLLNFITPPLVFNVFIWLAYFNSACNPIIYVFSYRWFRKALKLILSREIFSLRTPTVDLYQE
ncbi:trace amine-associated receptor 5 [Camelus ferus]|uniref:Trace amine-associated receptor 5 n=2 Tax=Camelus TaxID=9836 RepID=A0A8B8TF28_CAMFR|nr:trace amine-associated receptor 5 [Camelus bactrianus]XP_032340839.1 trace amine-associated receptor 5 [Camelus ferus]